ncbi:hypothetical protein ANN_07983 [Periplaneta americana]|uniref:Uncharacterized protein n=1 Tax=Periplaneta americana TaxID=6978 RepID=A0ABQ8T050_PERAM|nr:hypothetical protein ANN_07983 [Periplaneta americana]
MSPRSSTESYPAFARIGLRENPGKNLNQVTCPDRDSNPGHLVSRPDVLTVTPQLDAVVGTMLAPMLATVMVVVLTELALFTVQIGRSSAVSSVANTHGQKETKPGSGGGGGGGGGGGDGDGGGGGVDTIETVTNVLLEKKKKHAS